MKAIFISLRAALLLQVLISYSVHAQLFNKIKGDVSNDVKTSISNKLSNNSIPASTQSASNASPATASDNSSSASSAAPASAQSRAGGDIVAYNNYDFVPGQTIIFADNFTNEQDGEFPSQWKLERGQAVMNNVGGVNSFVLTQGNYAIVSPRIKSPSYLTDPFTLEFDYFVPPSGNYGMIASFLNGTNSSDVHVAGDGQVQGQHFGADYPADHSPQAFRNKWHHVAIAYKNNQLKVYVDQYRVMVDPDLAFIPRSCRFESIGEPDHLAVFTNIRIASGGGMNMIGKKFTDAKIITHGINFDYDKATIKPESMGTLNMIVKIMKGDPDVKFEIGGHTDGDGEADYNLKLSQDRADAVRAQLIAMGIDGGRLTSKGFGKTKPIADNTTEEGKANNRRVEFVKI